MDNALPSHPVNDEFDSLKFDFNYAARQHDGVDGALPLLHDVEVSAVRQPRWEREALVRTQFLSSDTVFELRATVARLRQKLVAARTEVGAYERLVRKLSTLR